MTGFRSTTLPYTMGNAGDLLKHGLLAEFVRWRCCLGKPVRFFDLFGGEPFDDVPPEVGNRVRALTGSALRDAQLEIGEDRYYGSGKVAQKVAESMGCSDVRVFTGDCDSDRCKRLRASGLRMLDEVVPDCGIDNGSYDAYAVFREMIHKAHEVDLVLIDDFACFLPHRAETTIPQMEDMAKRATVLLFALNWKPSNPVGKKFEELLAKHLKGAWRMTCPKLPCTPGIGGESKYVMEVVLAGRCFLEQGSSHAVAELRDRLHDYAMNLARVVRLSGNDAELLMPKVIGAGKC